MVFVLWDKDGDKTWQVMSHKEEQRRIEELVESKTWTNELRSWGKEYKMAAERE
jgi:hypothetical protein